MNKWKELAVKLFKLLVVVLLLPFVIVFYLLGFFTSYLVAGFRKGWNTAEDFV
jgi:hypothetical protein